MVAGMPVRFTIDHVGRYVTVRAEGIVVLDEILDYFDALVTQDAMPYRKLFDARDAEPRLSDDDVMVLGARVSAYAELEPRGPIATIASPGAAADVLRRFMNLGGAARAIKLFHSIEQARKWLAEQPEI
jgi:hypothetical protein